MAYENNDKKMESVYSKRIRAGKRRTYFFDVRATRGNDYFLTITESRKRFDDNGYYAELYRLQLTEQKTPDVHGQ